MPLGPAALPALIQDSTAQTSEVESLRGWWFSFVGCLLGPSVKASIETIMSLRKETAVEEEVVLLGLQSLPHMSDLVKCSFTWLAFLTPFSS